MEQQIDGGRRPRRSCVVGDVAWARDEPFRVPCRIEKGSDLFVPEPFDHGIGYLARAVHPPFVERKLVHREESQSDRGVILEEAADPRDSFLVGAHHAAVPYHFPGKEFGVLDGEVSEVGAGKNSGRGCGSAQHQPVPRSENLLIPSGPDAFRPRFVKNSSPPGENRVEQLFINS